MKFIAIGDIHASGFSDDPLSSVDGLPERLHWIKFSLDKIIEHGRQINISHYVMVGDIYNDKTLIYTVAQDMLQDFFTKNSDLTFHIISGNHDLSSTGELQKSAISVFRNYNNIIYYDKIGMNQELNSLLVEYSHDFMTTIKTVDDSQTKMDILISHLGLNEGVLQSGLSKVDKLKISDLNGRFKLLILGHYHKPQYISSSSANVYYVGSLTPTTWNDKNEQKRFLIVDSETMEVESVDITGVPMYRELIITDDMTTSDRQELINRAKEFKISGDKVRVINRCKETIATMNEGTAKNILSDIVIIEEKEDNLTDRGITITQSDAEQVKKYLEIKNIDDPAYHLDLLKKHNIIH